MLCLVRYLFVISTSVIDVSSGTLNLTKLKLMLQLLPWWQCWPRHRSPTRTWSYWSDRNDTPNAAECSPPAQIGLL